MQKRPSFESNSESNQDRVHRNRVQRLIDRKKQNIDNGTLSPTKIQDDLRDVDDLDEYDMELLNMNNKPQFGFQRRMH